MTVNIEEIIGGPANAQTVAATVGERLRDLILTGRLAPGTVLRLAPLAASFGVSVMPVREALRNLESEGLVIVQPRRGARVAELSVEDAEEIYALRIALETLCARHATERLTPADIAELERLFGEMQDAERAGDLAAFIECDHAFHAYLYGVSERPRLVRMISELQDRSRRYLPQLYEAWLMAEDPLEAHRPILAAIEARDAALVESLTHEHMVQAADRLLRSIARSANGRRSARPRSSRWSSIPVDGVSGRPG